MPQETHSSGGLRGCVTGLGRARWQTHAVLLLLTGAAYGLAALYLPRAAPSYLMTLAFGYLSLLLLALTLLIGPLRLALDRRRRRNPVNLDLRRDVGIWAGITGLLHVVFGFQQRFGGDILRFFLARTADGWRLLGGTLGAANHVGLLATLILVALLATSNDLSLRRLKGPRWKTLQRLNYALFGFAVLHTVLYQAISGREGAFATAVVVETLVTVVGQFAGLTLVQARRAGIKKP
jgi:sulfoxide reductase heme-binding subunit YedZ